MKLILLAVGKTDSSHLQAQIDAFAKRLRRYIPFQLECLPEPRSLGKAPAAVVRKKQGELLLQYVQAQDTVWLLDEKGAAFTSRGFAKHLQKAMNAAPKRLVVVVGGAYGFSPEVYQRAQGKVSLSKMTFNHQVVRLMAVEQLYRAFAILKGDPYHND